MLGIWGGWHAVGKGVKPDSRRSHSATTRRGPSPPLCQEKLSTDAAYPSNGILMDLIKVCRAWLSPLCVVAGSGVKPALSSSLVVVHSCCSQLLLTVVVVVMVKG